MRNNSGASGISIQVIKNFTNCYILHGFAQHNTWLKAVTKSQCGLVAYSTFLFIIFHSLEFPEPFVCESEVGCDRASSSSFFTKVRINRMNLIYDALLPLVLSGWIGEKKCVFPKTET